MKITKYILTAACLIISIICKAQFFPVFNDVQISTNILSENSVVINDLNNQKILIGCNHLSSNIAAPPQAQLGPGGLFDVACYKSNDGGVSWSEQILSINSLADPSVAFDNSGTNGKYYFLRCASDEEARVFQFDDNSFASPNTWADQSVTGVLTDGVDKCFLWIDNNPSSPFYHNMYYGYTKINTNLFPVCMRVSNTSSLNTISSEILLSNFTSNPAGFMNHSVNIKTDKNGKVYACWAIYDSPSPLDESGIGFAYYDPLSQTFPIKKRIQLLIRGTRGSGIIGNTGNGIITTPSMAVNQQNGHIYIVWTNQGEPGVNQNTSASFINPDVYFIKSVDGGINWSTPIRINNDYKPNYFNGDNNNYLAYLACDPVTGTLAAIYYDSRDRSTLSGQSNEQVYVALSDDEGDSWVESIVSNYGVTSGATVGHDYIGIDIKNNFVAAAYSAGVTNQARTWASTFSIACPDNDIITACNQTITTVEKIKAANSITIASNITTCNYNVAANGGDVTAYAGSYVKMQDGFHASAGSLFHAFIKPCNNFNFATHPQNRLIASSNIPSNENVYDNKKNTAALYEVYPNPLKDILTIKSLNNTANATAFLFDSFGQLITLQHLDTLLSEQSFELNLQAFELKQGVYFLKIINTSAVTTVKLVKR